MISWVLNKVRCHGIENTAKKKKQIKVVIPACRCALATSKIVPKCRIYQELLSYSELYPLPLQVDRIPRQLHKTDENLVRFLSTHRPGCILIVEANGNIYAKSQCYLLFKKIGNDIYSNNREWSHWLW